MKKNIKTIVGIILILLAALILVNAIVFNGSLHVWRIVVIALLVLIIIHSIKTRWFTGIFFPLAFIYIIMSSYWGVPSVGFGAVLLVALLLSIGCPMVFHRSGRDLSDFRKSCSDPYRDAMVDDSSYVSIRTTFGGISKKLESSDLKRLEIYASFSGIKVDFTDVRIPSGNVTITVESTFSGIELYVPRDYNIKSSIVYNVSGVNDMDTGLTSGPTLNLEGNMVCSGIKIVRV